MVSGRDRYVTGFVCFLSMDLPYGASGAAVERLGADVLCRGMRIYEWRVVSALCCSAHTPQTDETKPIQLAVASAISLTAGYGLPRRSAFPVRPATGAKGKAIVTEIANAGVSGDTASGGPTGSTGRSRGTRGRDRRTWRQRHALRGIDPKVDARRAGRIVKRLKARDIEVLLCGMYAPPNSA